MMELDTRQGWMGLLARAPADRLESLWINLGMDLPDFAWLRAPETGGVMVRGRMGGTGAPFNLGEMTVTRCAIRLEPGNVIGHAYVQGRDKSKARLAAVIDALMQTSSGPDLRARLLVPLAQEMAARAQGRAERAEATKVTFFTMVRGED
ncbi:alpha-D-ribose 1-methylphosphonate 5-triphosphate synthase subunit PhnG [Rhodovulum bhavnagarense]|uniref:Alpha-D-ribose 1-methylphosphonate 5-triphosphate synthase subunit PhnG n=1 Tax=Rhodovulum bhavnagarense TaxID=992286 RepID=A0A4R2RTH6_9RHOB|nr:phosphonate C-P lyase system protein PhnG [Rhodovulum bhavnagarense]TCP63201.1 alpha-D-ribose 1-methylphosphonate 5-triphosphate synthase subunit PhnG [Rhodovulum bhavnagarense]